MSSSARFGGVCLVAAAFTFWLAWFLMPLPGTTDVAFILEQVGVTPERVWWSVAVQMLSSALFAPALLALAREPGLGDRSGGFAALALAGIGVTGLAADAIYHLLAYEMVQPGIERAAMVPVMARFQAQNLVFVAPQLIALLVGLAWLAVLAARAGVVSRVSPRLQLAALGLALAGGAAVRVAGGGRRALALGVLALFSLSIAWLGAALAGARARSA